MKRRTINGIALCLSFPDCFLKQNDFNGECMVQNRMRSPTAAARAAHLFK